MKVLVYLEYQGKKYVIEDPHTSHEMIVFMWTEGNYDCDCNRSLFIREQNHDFPELPCGDEIKLIKIELIPDGD